MFQSELEKLAARLAIEAPEKRGTYSATARVTWRTIEETRAALDARGFDWRKARADYLAILKERGR